MPNGHKPIPRVRRSRPSGRLTFLRRRWVRYLVYAAGALALVFGATFTYFYVSLGNIIDQRLHGERERTLPRVYARPVVLRRGQLLSEDDLVARLNVLGYAQRPQVEGPGQFAITRNSVTITPREGKLAGRAVRIVFPPAPSVRQAAGSPPRRGIRQIEIVGRGNADSVELDPPLLTALMTSGAREKRRHVLLDTIPDRKSTRLNSS